MFVFAYETISPSGESETGILPEYCTSMKQALAVFDEEDYEQVTIKKIKKKVYDQLCDFRRRERDCTVSAEKN
jgi:hypothetical protein